MKLFVTILFFLLAINSYAQLSTDFESGTLAAWEQVPANRWAAATNTPLSGNYSLKHCFDNTGGATDIIYQSLDSLAVNSGIIQWRFLLRHGHAPSENNKWAAFLFASQPGSEWKAGGTFEGYALGVNMTNIDDTLALYAVHNNRFTIITKTIVNWQEDVQTDGAPAIEITRNAEGMWVIKLAHNGSMNDLQPIAPAVTHNTCSHANYFGFSYTYTASADRQLWIDNVSVDFTKVIAPTKIQHAALTTQKSLTVLFSQKVAPAMAAVAQHYQLIYLDTLITPIEATVLSDREVLLHFVQPLPRGDAQLAVTDVIDENSAPVSDSYSLPILYLLYGDVVINEIMADPVPSIALPEATYIELYNRLPLPVPLNGWKMEYNTTVGNIGTATIPAHGYIILCAAATLDLMQEYGNAINVSYISSLTQSGKTLSLKDHDGALLSRVAYSNDWISDSDKRAGGWALEKTDPDNLSDTPANWQASVDAKGGTPGQPNSVYTHNPDREAPLVSRLEYIDAQTLLLTFNELFDPHSATHTSSYAVNNHIGHPQEAQVCANQPEQVKLLFQKSFQKGVAYLLTVTAPFHDLAGNTPEEKHYPFGHLFSPGEQEIIINEVLFNPPTNGVDFVELYNCSDKIFDLRQLKIANRNKNNEISSIYNIASNNEPAYYLPPHDFIVLTTDLTTLQAGYSVPFPEKAVTLSALPSYPDENGCVVLLSGENTVIDEFLYSHKMHSGFITNPEGISLERVNPLRPADEPANWQSAARDAGFATPTDKNSQYNVGNDNATEAFTLSPAVFSPDGDGHNDVLYIDCHLNTSGYVATITVYDTQGRLVKEIEKKTLLGTSGRFAWDGTRYDQQKARPGIYIVLIEYFNSDGHVKHIKHSCALAIPR